MWDTTKQTNICIIGVPGGKERESGEERIFEEIMLKTSQI